MNFHPERDGKRVSISDSHVLSEIKLDLPKLINNQVWPVRLTIQKDELEQICRFIFTNLTKSSGRLPQNLL